MTGQPMARARSLTEFQRAFPDEASCAAFLFERRWPGGFVCPVCGKGRAAALKSRAYTYECSDCGRQTSITAGLAAPPGKATLNVFVLVPPLQVSPIDRTIAHAGDGPTR